MQDLETYRHFLKYRTLLNVFQRIIVEQLVENLINKGTTCVTSSANRLYCVNNTIRFPRMTRKQQLRHLKVGRKLRLTDATKI